MKMISKSRFKPRALEIMRGIEKTGQPVIITDHGKPTLELRPYKANQVKQDPIAYLKNSVLEYTDPTKPVAGEDWDAAD